MTQTSHQEFEPVSSSGSRRAKDPAIPFALDTAANWAWRLLVILAAAACLWWAFSKVSLLVISIAVAALIAGLISPVVYFFRKRKVPAGIAVAIAELGLIALVLGLLALVGQQMAEGFSDLSNQVAEGYQRVLVSLNNLPFNIGTDQVDSYISNATEWVKNNSGQILSSLASVGSTAGNLGTGAVITLFTLIFFLLEGEKIWLFIVRLFPRNARTAVNGAGRRGWKSLVSYVQVQVLVAFIDALGIGLAAFFLGVPLAFPLGVLVFLGSFIPVVGALFTGAIAVLLALVANGPINALLMLLMVLLVQQIESNILQPLIMGKAVSLHPLAVVLVVAMGSILFGIVGALLAVPVMAVINTVVRYLAHREWESDPEIRTETFLYPHEIEKKNKKAIAEKVKERLENLKDKNQAESAKKVAEEDSAPRQ
ncbi:AI-2E family transporter [Rothia aerolata]|uniref:AI-2E family transporter n=1 Tax=Rothia aerolata TaxID=1812262 RepID=A0A917IV82_9MICC|nr:AI-2E family transporter [Rothia aerolata]GGH62745.1 AI-2E family transporter [Rothia aerolata]